MIYSTEITHTAYIAGSTKNFKQNFSVQALALYCSSLPVEMGTFFSSLKVIPMIDLLKIFDTGGDAIM